MDAVIESFLSGFPVLMLHASVTLAMLAMGVFLYVKITPYDEIELVQAGNTAAAASLAGAIIGLSSLGFAEILQLTFGERVLLLGWKRITAEQAARSAHAASSIACAAARSMAGAVAVP